jgi:hypothetical protein
MNNEISNKPTFGDLSGMQKFKEERLQKKKQENEEELQKIMADKYYDPTIGKNPLKDGDTKKIEKLLPNHKNENLISKNRDEISEVLDVFENPDIYDIEEDKNQTDNGFIDSYSKEFEDDLSTQDDIDYNNKKETFENNTDILGLKTKIEEKKEKKREEEENAKKELKEKPEYSEFERIVLKQTVYNYIEGKGQFIDDKKLSKEQIIEAIDEFKQNFPGEFASMINRKLITSDFKWKKEIFKDKDILVSYYPNLENPKIKYVINLDKESGNKVKIENKVFVKSSVKSDGTVYKDENGVILVFCSAPKQNDKRNVA